MIAISTPDHLSFQQIITPGAEKDTAGATEFFDLRAPFLALASQRKRVHPLPGQPRIEHQQ
jgi:hypothetical protein